MILSFALAQNVKKVHFAGNVFSALPIHWKGIESIEFSIFTVVCAHCSLSVVVAYMWARAPVSMRCRQTVNSACSADMSVQQQPKQLSLLNEHFLHNKSAQFSSYICKNPALSQMTTKYCYICASCHTFGTNSMYPAARQSHWMRRRPWLTTERALIRSNLPSLLRTIWACCSCFI